MGGHLAARTLTGEARLDRRGFHIHDRDQGWTFRLGDVQAEMLADVIPRSAAPHERAVFEDFARAGPILGLHWRIRF